MLLLCFIILAGLLQCFWGALARFDDSVTFPGDPKLRSIVGGWTAASPPEDDPVAFVIKKDHVAKVYGRREGKYPNSYYRFYGVRYAEPPVGRYRFQRSKKMKLEGEVFGYKPGAPCPQPDPNRPDKIIGSEDCLFLNIFTPKLPDSDQGMPVLFWIHGGGFRRGSASQYGGGLLTRRDVIVVAVQYRLGSLGFLSTGQRDMPGNAAMFDLSTALAWVRDYIEFFGGDPNNIVPVGHGTGASSALLLTMSNVTQGRSAGVVAMSGTAVSPFAIDNDPKDTLPELAKRNKCPQSTIVAAVKCLQQLSPENLITSDTVMEEKLGKKDDKVVTLGDLLSPGPVVEDVNDERSLPPYLAEKPRTTYENANHLPKIPLLTGVTKHETAGAVTGVLKNHVLNALKNIPNYLDKVLVPGLLKKQAKSLYTLTTTGTTALNSLTGNYLKFRPKALEDGINQIIEATSDALFNFPAHLTGSSWAKLKVPTYLYSFDHSGKLAGAEKFLLGSLLAGNQIENKKIGAVSHGSELPYLFEVRSLEGIPDPNFNESTPLDPEDQKVRDNFLDLIANFVKTKTVDLKEEKKSTQFPSYISILPKVNVGDKFRECQMALWGGLASGSSKCAPLQLVTSGLLSGLGGLTGAGSKLNSTLGVLPSLSLG